MVKKIDFSKFLTYKDAINGFIKNFPKYKTKFDSLTVELTETSARLDENYKKIIEVLREVGLDDFQEHRLFRHHNGKYRFNNLLKNEKTKAYNYKRNYKKIMSLSDYSNEIIESEDGVLVPSFKNNYNILYVDDSEYFICTNKILICDDVSSGISLITNNRIESDKLEVLIKRIPEDIGLVLIKNRDTIILTGEVRYVKINLLEFQCIEILNKLDNMEQPYPRGYLIDSETGKPNSSLMRIVEKDDLLHVVNQLFGHKFLRSEHEIFDENPKIKQTGFKALPTIHFNIDINGNVTCQDFPVLNHNKLIIGISCIIEGRQNHQMILIIDDDSALLFDPSYQKNFDEDDFITKLYSGIGSYFHDKDFHTTKDLGIDYDYSLQSNYNDIYCISWSYYFAILFLLNDDFIDDLYSLGKYGLKVAIARFVLYTAGEDLFSIIDEVYTENLENN